MLRYPVFVSHGIVLRVTAVRLVQRHPHMQAMLLSHVSWFIQTILACVYRIRVRTSSDECCFISGLLLLMRGATSAGIAGSPRRQLR